MIILQKVGRKIDPKLDLTAYICQLQPVKLITLNYPLMKKVRHSVLQLFLILAISSSPLNIQAQDPDQGLLWEISGNNMPQSSYLFGTIHFISNKDFFMTKQIKETMKVCKILSTETLMNHHTRNELNRNAHLPDGGSLEDLMSPEDYEKVKSFFVSQLRVKRLRFDLHYKHLKPLVLSTTMTMLHLGNSVKFYETEFLKLARKYDMETLGLETIEVEIEAMNHFPLEDQVAALLHSVENFDQHFGDFEELVDAYKAGDLESILQITLRPSEDNYEFHRHFIDYRNVDWLTKMDKKMDLAPTFFAVGAAHLGGDNGLIKLLRQKGYTLNAVEIKRLNKFEEGP